MWEVMYVQMRLANARPLVDSSARATRGVSLITASSCTAFGGIFDGKEKERHTKNRKYRTPLLAMTNIVLSTVDFCESLSRRQSSRLIVRLYSLSRSKPVQHLERKTKKTA